MSAKRKGLTAVALFAILLIVALVTIGFERDHVESAKSPFLFEHEIIDPDPPSGSGCCLDVMAVGDIDGDGQPDVMVGSQNSIGAVWYHYPDWHRYVIGAGDFTTDGKIVDLDRDGDGDVVISSISRDDIEWWENTGDPFKPSGWIRHTIGPRFAHDVLVGDINGDGRADVVMLRKDRPRQLTWFEAPPNPRGHWVRHQIDTPVGEGLALADIDGDGDLDIVAASYWYENRDGKGLHWVRHAFTTAWHGESRDVVGDLNGDGKPDIVRCSDKDGRLEWFENPSWKVHLIDPEPLKGCHSLAVADFDRDGLPDVFAGEMNTGGGRLLRHVIDHRVMVYRNLGGGQKWQRVVLGVDGTHNAQVADIDADGDLDIVGKNYTGTKQVELWRNETPSRDRLSLDRWHFIQIDDARQAYRDSQKYWGLAKLLHRGAKAYLGLAVGDLTGDGYQDIVSGRYFYRNPGGDMTAHWVRSVFPSNVDGMLITDVDGDGRGDVIAEALPGVYWLKPSDSQGQSWTVKRVATLPKTIEGNGQGYKIAQINPGPRPQVLLSAGTSDIFYLTIPDDPRKVPWPRTLITDQATDEDIGVGDIDGDGRIDVAAGDMHTGGNKVAWWRNPGDGTANWKKFDIGTVAHWPDRIAVADINGDGRPDIIVSEEVDDDRPDAHVYWFEQPADPRSAKWPRHLVTTEYSTNSMDVADMDGDGIPDIITGEHRGADRVSIWRNVDRGRVWEKHVVASGKESHLGARTADLDGDGDRDIISIAWSHYQNLYLWRNDARAGCPDAEKNNCTPPAK